MILTSSMLPDFSDNYGFQDFTAGALSRSVPFYRALTSAPLDSPHSISNSSHSQQNGRDGAAAVSPAALNLTRLLPRTKMQAAAFFSTLSSKSPIASRSGRGTNGKTASCHNKSGPGKGTGRSGGASGIIYMAGSSDTETGVSSSSLKPSHRRLTSSVV